MKRLLLTGGLFVLVGVGFAQDIHFSQYNENPLLINPALTGSQYVMRAAVMYKDQWGSVTVPYRTFGGFYEMKFKASAWEKQDPFRTRTYKKAFNRLAGGLAFYSDKAGDGNMGTNRVDLSLASFIKVGEGSSLSVGLQGGVVQKTVDYSKFIFSNQYTGSGYSQDIPSNELYGSKSFIYPDFAAGVLYNFSRDESSIGENNMLKADFGFAFTHINKPKQDFLSGTDEKLFSKYVVHGKYLIGIPHSNLGLAPSFLFQFQGPQKELILGLMAKYYIHDDSRYTGYIRKSSFGVGVYYRYADAIVPTVLLELGQYNVGFSYDLNISGLTAVSALRGGMEITLRFNSANPFLFQKK